MGKINSQTIRQTLNYYIVEADKKVKKLVSTPAAIKKCFQTCVKATSAIDLARLGHIVKRDVTDAMDGTIKFIGFYYTYNNIMYWINPFTKESIDREILKNSLKIYLNINFNMSLNKIETKNLVDEVFKEVMSKAEYHNKDQMRAELKDVLKKKMKSSSLFTDDKINNVDKVIVIKKAKRSTSEKVAKFSYLIADFGDNLLTLKDWGVPGLSSLARSMGQRIPIFGSEIVKIGAKSILGTIYSVGFVFTIGHTTIQIRKKENQINLMSLNDIEKSELKKEIENLKLERITAGFDLLATLPTLLFTVNPPVALALGILAKGIGFICVMSKVK